MMSTSLATLVAAAVRAPSGDNTQPWRFRLDEAAGRVTFLLDETRDPSNWNAGQRMARIAVGAALENLVREAVRRGGTVVEEAAAPPALAAVRVSLPDRAAPDDPGIRARVTNRRRYDGRPVSAALLAELAAATPPDRGVTTHWITGRERLRELGVLLGRADVAMFNAPEMFEALVRNVRFEAPALAEVDEGLSLGSLELSAAERVLFPLIPRLPHGLLRATGTFRRLGDRSRTYLAGSSGLCFVVAPDGTPETDLVVGRATERAWLGLTEKGLAAQPMMSLLGLEGVFEFGRDVDGLSRSVYIALRDGLRAAVPEIAGRRPAFMMRFGYASAPTARVGRLPVAAVVEIEAKTP